VSKNTIRFRAEAGEVGVAVRAAAAVHHEQPLLAKPQLRQRFDALAQASSFSGSNLLNSGR
jgi:hypothetical protein